MKKSVKLSLIVAAAAVSLSSAIAAADAPAQNFAPAKMPAAVIQGTADASNAAAVVDVAIIRFERELEPVGFQEKIKAKWTGKKPILPAGEAHKVGVYIGKGLVLLDSLEVADKYRVTFANGRSMEATLQLFEHDLKSRVMLLRLATTDGLPEPAKLAANSPSIGDEVTIFSASEMQYIVGSRHTSMLRGYVSAQAVKFFNEADAPKLIGINTDREPQNAAREYLGPVFSRGQIVGVAVLSADGETYAVPVGAFAPQLAKVLAKI